MKTIRRTVIRYLIACLALAPFSAQAGMVGTETVVPAAARINRDRMFDFLARAEVRKQMLAFGVDPEQARMRVDALTDEEVQRIAGRVGSVPAGGDLTPYALGILVAIIVAIVFIYWK